MELKYKYFSPRLLGLSSSNRTFMELKSPSGYHQVYGSLIVLIVPLWNWNAAEAPALISAAGSNRTFMELK